MGPTTNLQQSWVARSTNCLVDKDGFEILGILGTFIAFGILFDTCALAGAVASGDEGGKDQYQGHADADTDLGAIGQTRFGGFDGEAFVSCSWYRTKGG